MSDSLTHVVWVIGTDRECCAAKKLHTLPQSSHPLSFSYSAQAIRYFSGHSVRANKDNSSSSSTPLEQILEFVASLFRVNTHALKYIYTLNITSYRYTNTQIA